MRVFKVFLLVFLMILVSFDVYGQELVQDGIIDSMELCPFTIEVYPETLHVGDMLHVKMSFENKSDMITWALPRQIAHKELSDSNIVKFIFQDAKTGIQYPWIFHGTNEWGWVRDVWQPVKPGEKGKTQFWTLGFPPLSEYRSNSYNPFQDIYHFSYSGQSLLMMSSLNDHFLESLQNDGGEGHLMVMLHTRQGGTAEAPINKTITVTCLQKITILSRPKAEIEMIHNFYSSGLTYSLPTYTEVNYEAARHDFSNVIAQTTPGTLRNLMQMHLYYLELYACYHQHSKKPVEELLLEIIAWLDNLPELERDYLKHCFGSQFGTDGEFHNTIPEAEKEMIREIFGKPDWEQREPLDLSPWNGRNPYLNPKLHPSNTTDSEPKGGGGYG